MKVFVIPSTTVSVLVCLLSYHAQTSGFKPERREFNSAYERKVPILPEIFCELHRQTVPASEKTVVVAIPQPVGGQSVLNCNGKRKTRDWLIIFFLQALISLTNQCTLADSG
ncbi:MAG: hypothetical protein LUD71_00330 [Clostridiales bacterium]|nr:hypothetical protein [Clostridiales bacterium]